MPRPLRPDLRPVILMPDISEQQHRARSVVDSRYNVAVYESGDHAPFVKRYDAFDHWIRFLRGEGETVDHEIINCMLGRLAFADAREAGPPREDGLIPYTLFVPGCRVQMRQRDIADELGCSTERVRLAIKRLKICEIIVTSGNGWYEFDAHYFWKGNEQMRRAYLPIQAEFIRIILT